MAAVSTSVRLFPLFAADHPLAAPVADFARQIEERAARHPAPQAVHAEIKALPDADGGWRLERFYWSGQSWAGPGRAGFAASTLIYAGRQGARWHSFPSDPRLGDVGAALADLSGARIEVLRYVPLRRLTFRIAEAGGPGLIGKIRRRSRFLEADARLAAVARAAAGLVGELRVAAPVGLNTTRCLALQEALPGACLSDLIDLRSAPALLARVGGLHRALHELEVPGVPDWDADAFLGGIANHRRWVAFARPELAAELAALGRLLDATAPDLAEGRCFCHGDFVPSQVLAGDGPWGVVDFDLCRAGDPCQELATLLAALPYDVPALAAAPEEALERAGAAYLGGYEERAGRPVDGGRLRWHRLCAEIAYLGTALKKDWLDEPGLAVALGRLRARAADLRRWGAR